MARKSLYSPERAELIVRYIKLGYALKDAAYAARVSTETIRRWREQYADFNRQMVKASNEQWEHPEDLIKYHHPTYRSYKRPKIALSEHYGAKGDQHPSLDQKPLLEPLRHPRAQFMAGLPVRPRSILYDLDDLVETPPYYNAENGMVEWITKYPRDGRLVFSHCHLEVYKQNRTGRESLPCPIVVI